MYQKRRYVDLSTLLELTPSRRQFLLGSAAASAATLLFSCQSSKRSSVASHPEFASAKIDWRQAEGQEISLAIEHHQWTNALLPLLPGFTELTGIQVKTQISSETEYLSSVPLLLESASPTPDVFMAWSLGEAVPKKMLEPLNPYYENPNLTDLAWYDEADIFPSARQFAVWPADKERYAVAITVETELVYIRKDLLDAKGLAAPKTFDDLHRVAKALKGNGVAGIAMRAKPTHDSVPWPAGGFVYSFGGEIVDEQGRVVFDSPESVAAIDAYARLLKDAGPPNAGMYHWYELLSDFCHRKAAMIVDANVFIADIANPEKNEDAARVSYHAYPSHADKPSSPNLWHWMLGMNPSSRKKVASWLFLQWVTSRPTSTLVGRNRITTGRISALKDEANRKVMGEIPADIMIRQLEATDASKAARTYFHPKTTKICDLFASAINRAVIGAADAKTALSEGALKANKIISG